KDKNSGEKKDKTEWHRIVIFSQGLVGIAKNYVKKGSKLYIEGALQSRKWTDSQGNEKTTTEIVLQNYSSVLQILDRNDRQNSGNDYQSNQSSGGKNNQIALEDNDDEIPF
ncbi:MAG: single-stranded DNA-binding protein, partial [Proteobacteria bacterium]|nr:single-stranded DNA-binding protein [Pseudomonadota bacterium]